jgi:hypothetical protein
LSFRSSKVLRLVKFIETESGIEISGAGV